MKTQSSELQRVAEEKLRNEQRHLEWLRKSAIYRYVDTKNRYKDKRLGAEYESWLDKNYTGEPDSL